MASSLCLGWSDVQQENPLGSITCASESCKLGISITRGCGRAEALHPGAEAMSISQSGLSASIRALERELHASSFVRNTHLAA
ncbi:hypothetical protein GCM10009744_63890 [Kribbella alba]|uniref:LysR family transcriptional regulator n=1 Tax=Kribbella alba TaxID=190197 RepID=A0ABN2FXK6_9ACTN